MRNSNFVKLDFATIQPYFKQMVFLPIIALVLGVLMKNLYFIIIMTAGYSWMVCIYPFSIADKYHLDVMYSALPGSRKQIVKGRYLFFIAIYWIGALLSICLGYIVHLILAYDFSLIQGGLIVIGIFPFACLIIGIFYCVMFKFGYLKARFINPVPILLIYFGGALINSFIRDNTLAIQSIPPLGIVAASLGLGLILIYISFRISHRIYEKKDF